MPGHLHNACLWLYWLCWVMPCKNLPRGKKFLNLCEGRFKMVWSTHVQGDFFNWSRPKSSKCWRWQNPYQKSESKGISQRKYEVLTQTFTFLVGILPSPTLRTFRAGPVKKVTLYIDTFTNFYEHMQDLNLFSSLIQMMGSMHIFRWLEKLAKLHQYESSLCLISDKNP